jgi:hypothetical protein
MHFTISLHITIPRPLHKSPFLTIIKPSDSYYYSYHKDERAKTGKLLEKWGSFSPSPSSPKNKMSLISPINFPFFSVLLLLFLTGLKPGGHEIFRAHPDRLWEPQSVLYNGYRVSFPELKRPGRSLDHPPPSTVEIEHSYISASAWSQYLLGMLRNTIISYVSVLRDQKVNFLITGPLRVILCNCITTAFR